MNKFDFKPYYAVIFTSKLNENDEGYVEMANLMESLAKKQEGFLGLDTARNAIGITISYWDSEVSIQKWKKQSDHMIAQTRGKLRWYNWYHIRICKVEREYQFKSDN